MPYVETVWVDDDGSGTVGTIFTSTRMNKIEQGVTDAQPPRDEVQHGTASLPGNASEVGVVSLGLSSRVLRVAADRACRVRLYTTAAKRDADAARAIGTDPTGDHGLILEVVLTATLLALDLAPQPLASNMDAPPADSIYYNIENRSTAGAVTVTFTRQRLEY